MPGLALQTPNHPITIAQFSQSFQSLAALNPSDSGPLQALSPTTLRGCAVPPDEFRGSLLKSLRVCSAPGAEAIARLRGSAADSDGTLRLPG